MAVGSCIAVFAAWVVLPHRAHGEPTTADARVEVEERVSISAA
jgi:hypothetical protein